MCGGVEGGMYCLLSHFDLKVPSQVRIIMERIWNYLFQLCPSFARVDSVKWSIHCNQICPHMPYQKEVYSLPLGASLPPELSKNGVGSR